MVGREAVSAFKRGVARPEFDRLVAAALGGDIDVLLVQKVDRLGRNLAHGAKVAEQLADARVRVCSNLEGLDTADEAGRRMLQMLLLGAEWASSDASARIRAKRRAACAEARPLRRRTLRHARTRRGWRGGLRLRPRGCGGPSN